MNDSTFFFDTKLAAIQAKINQACQQASRDPNDICLIAVSKKHGIDKIKQAFAAGQTHFGENFLQEALSKQEALSDLPIHWHFIGQIQSNKIKKIAQNFTWIHSVDRLETAKKLSKHAPEGKTLKIFLQINIDEEASKAGFLITEPLYEIVNEVIALPRISLQGFMCMPDPAQSLEQKRLKFEQLRAYQTSLNEVLPHLSMGMSDDFSAAIQAGATHIRVGSAIFGERDYSS